MELLICNEEIISKNIKYKKMLIDIHVMKYLLHLDIFLILQRYMKNNYVSLSTVDTMLPRCAHPF